MRRSINYIRGPWQLFLSSTYFTEGHIDLTWEAIGLLRGPVPEFLRKWIATCDITGLEVIKLEFILRLKTKRNDWLLCGHVQSSQLLRFILSLRLYSSFISSRPGGSGPPVPTLLIRPGTVTLSANPMKLSICKLIKSFGTISLLTECL